MTLESEYRPQLISFLLSVGASPDDAEDVTQDTLLKAIKWGIHTRDSKTAKSWLFITAKRELFDVRALGNNRATCTYAEVLTVKDDTAQINDRVFLDRVLSDLNAQDLEILKQIFEGAEMAEGAANIGMSTPAFKSRFYRIKRWANAKYN